MFESSVSRLLRDLDRAGASLWLEGEMIAFRGLPPEQIAEVRKYRAEVIELLKLHGEALLPLFRDPARPLTDRERCLIEANASELRRRFRRVGDEKPAKRSA
jgi:hypothetical protein